MRVAIVAVSPSNSEAGGAERFYEGLVQGFKSIGHMVELIAMLADETSYEQILNNYNTFKALDLSDYDLVISTKVPTYAVTHPNHIVYLVHTVRVFDDMFDTAIESKTIDHYRQRAKLHAMDLAALTQAKAIFAIGHEVANRLYRWRGIACEVMHPPLGFNQFRAGATGDYFFLPGRLHPWKRVDLLITAIKSSALPMRLIIAGTGEAEQTLRKLAAGDTRIEFVGRISDAELVRLYSNALAVPFTPLHEDYGYVTLEAFASGKPVVTCTDSGEPCHFVRQFETGLIVEPEPSHLCEALEWIYTHQDEASRMGQKGLALVQAMSWENAAAKLAEIGAVTTYEMPESKIPVTVLDMQPIDPPIGGGRLRLLGLYHALGNTTPCTYIGSYDWSGEPYRSHAITETLHEINVPLSEEHHAAAAALGVQAGGKVVIDIAFSQQGTLSPDYIAAAKSAIQKAKVVIFSHPWVYPLVRDALRPEQVVIYDAQNVEGYLRAQLLDEENLVQASLVRKVIEDEYHLGLRSDWILACSQEDLLRFHRVYELAPEKLRVFPNGVMAFNGYTRSEPSRHAARKNLKLPQEPLLGIFIGSGYGPNLQAAQFIEAELAPLLPEVIFVIAGGVGADMTTKRSNVRLTGQLHEAEKYQWLQASDFAVNPMSTGSGTNIKMFDFMAMSLPVVTTKIGARGIETGGLNFLLETEPDPQAFARAIRSLMESGQRLAMGNAARQCVEERYAWERISAELGIFIQARGRLAGQPKPLYSVVIPSYERHHQLPDLFECLRQQIERDFEVVLVDQSATPWQAANQVFGFPLTYYHCPVKGAVRARNTGAMLAQGEILAFVDDDCKPDPEWLLRARTYFDDTQTVGVEGMIYSDHVHDGAYRPVSNVGFEGIGFMTANLLVRAGAFQCLGGFDPQFDHPHFREDTDLGWRLLEIGLVPYANDVRVFHPAQPRELERESLETRNTFFEKDALLFKKHPERYRQLFFAENHFSTTPGFLDNLRNGFIRYDVPVPDWLNNKF